MGKKKDKKRSDSVDSDGHEYDTPYDEAPSKSDKKKKRSDSYESNDSDMSKKYGKPKAYDKDFKGPIQNRSCTDIPCCLLFIAFIAGFGAISAIAFMNGDPNTIIYPTDYKGNVCNVSQEVIGKPYSMYFDYLQCLDLSIVLELKCPSPTVCLAVCPTETYSIYTRYLPQLYLDPPFVPPIPPVNWDDFICLYDIDPEYEVITKGRKIYDLLLTEDCAGWYVESVPIGGRCLPYFLAPGEDAPLNGTSPNGRNITEDHTTAVEELVNFILASEQVNNMYNF